MPDAWSILEATVTHSGARVMLLLRNEDKRTLRVYLTAGEVAVLGKAGPMLYDGKLGDGKS